MVERNTVILVAGIVGAFAIALPITIIQMINSWQQLANSVSGAIDDSNYVAVSYVNNTAKVTLTEGQKTDFVRLVYVDRESGMAQLELTSYGCFGGTSKSSYLLMAGENATGCPTRVILLDVPAPGSATFELRQAGCFCPICWHLIYGKGDHGLK